MDRKFYSAAVLYCCGRIAALPQAYTNLKLIPLAEAPSQVPRLRPVKLLQEKNGGTDSRKAQLILIHKNRRCFGNCAIFPVTRQSAFAISAVSGNIHHLCPASCASAATPQQQYRNAPGIQEVLKHGSWK